MLCHVMFVLRHAWSTCPIHTQCRVYHAHACVRMHAHVFICGTCNVCMHVRACIPMANYIHVCMSMANSSLCVYVCLRLKAFVHFCLVSLSSALLLCLLLSVCMDIDNVVFMCVSPYVAQSREAKLTRFSPLWTIFSRSSSLRNLSGISWPIGFGRFSLMGGRFSTS